MQKNMLILSLAGLAGLFGATKVSAQFRAEFGGRNGSNIGRGAGGYYSPNNYYGGQRYGSNYRNFGQGYGNAYQYAPGYYSTPGAYADPGTNYYAQPQTTQSYYPAPTVATQLANITVLVPEGNAQVWFDNSPTNQQGMERLFHSPPLAPNQTFAYTIKARWTENGQAVSQERRVNVQTGQNVTVNFRERVRENVSPTTPRLPVPFPRN